jgi:adenylyltransferase/sulfurtransferase
MILTDNEIKRYQRQMILDGISLTGQDALKRAKVLVVGAGGLGCPVLLYLSSAGVGNIGIIDGDDIEISNLHRQVLYSNSDIGKGKAVTASHKLTVMNPDISINPFGENLTSENAKSIIEDYDVVVDCTDNYQARYLINDVGIELNKPFVFGSLYKHEGQCAILNYNNGPTYRCIFPKPPGPESSANCEDAGVLGSLCGIIGSIQADMILELLLYPAKVQNEQLVVYSRHTNQTSSYKVKRKVNNIKTNLMKTINPKEFYELDKSNIQIVDVREVGEEPIVSDYERTLIPLQEVPGRADEIKNDSDVYVICRSGRRSAAAIDYLSQQGYSNLINVEGGTLGFIEQKELNK